VICENSEAMHLTTNDLIALANTVSLLICRVNYGRSESRLLRADLARCIYVHFAEFPFEGFSSLLPTVVKLFFFVYFFIYSLCISCIVATSIGE